MEGFFQNGSSLDLIEVEELLLFRYANMEYILNLEISEGILLINKAFEKREEQEAWDMWLTKYPNMDEETFIPFSEFCDIVTGRNIVTKPKEEILREAEEIERKSQAKRGEIDGT